MTDAAATGRVDALQALQARVERLEAIEAIRALKARYTALADAKYTPDYARQPEAVMREVALQQASCFTLDAVWAGGAGFGSDLVGRERLHEWFQHSPWRFALHYYTSESISVEGGFAQASWRLWQMALREDDGQAVLLSAVTEESYRREADEGWLISHMRFTQLHMFEPSRRAMPFGRDFAALDAQR